MIDKEQSNPEMIRDFKNINRKNIYEILKS
jgi:hypothetical protein